MSTYRTRTYIAADFDEDRNAVDKLREWNNGEKWSLSFTDAHDLHSSNDTSLSCSIKSSLKERMDASKTFALIVGKYTDTITKGGCQYCENYSSYHQRCARGHSVDYRSYIKFECEKAVEAGINIIVLYNSINVDKSKCPDVVKYKGVHKAMQYYKDGKYYWDYQNVKAAFNSVN